MKRPFLLVMLLSFLAALLLAQPAQDASPPAALRQLESSIQAELESHGERVMGNETYHWSTRLERIENCRAELRVRITSNFRLATVQDESVSFSLGSIELYTIEMQKSRLELPCARGEKCIFSTSTCRTKTKEGLSVDCTTSSQKRVNSFALQLDGDPASAARLERDFRTAVRLCREPAEASTAPVVSVAF
jgi:hypothetical protein